ncbi:hypothetical protein [Pseudomonas sp.]|uniref:hypothetical protein n=1 Tax=Pseudomonas sp. TaxID=306 RepID=UPI003D0E7DE3
MSSKTVEYDVPAQDRVLFALLAFITPIIGGVFLPWKIVVGLIILMIFAIAIIALAGYPEIAKKLPAPLFMLIIGFGFQLWGRGFRVSWLLRRAVHSAVQRRTPDVLGGFSWAR